MEFIESISIEKPCAFVAEKYLEIRYSKDFNKDLLEVRSIEGMLGESGSITELAFKPNAGGVQKETIISKEFPNELTYEIENEVGRVKTTVLFIELDIRRTELKTRTEYAGMGGLISFGMRAQKRFIRKQLRESLHRVKAICEACI